MSYSSEVLADSPFFYYNVDNGVPSLTATSSTNYGSEPPANAIDGNASTYWTTNGFPTGWLRLALSEASTWTDYSIRRRDDIPTRNPKTWTFEGSNDGSAWTVLDTQTNITWPTAGETKKFTFANSTSYLYYRLNVSANNGDTYLSVAEISSTGSMFQDSSGHGDLGTRSGSMTTLQPPAASIPGHSLSLSGGYIGSGTPIGSVSALTVEAWVKTTTATGTIYGGRNAAPGLTLQIGSAAGGAFGAAGEVSFGIDGSGLYIGSSTTTARVNDGAWHHIVGIWAGSSGAAVIPSQFTIYVDGAAAAMTARGIAGSATAPVNMTDAPRIGNAPQWSTSLTGNVDEVAVYKAALSASRISTHYQAGIGALAAGFSGWGIGI